METKWKGTGIEQVNNLFQIYDEVPKDQRARRGISVTIHKNIKNALGTGKQQMTIYIMAGEII